jgi:hypothetical protein
MNDLVTEADVMHAVMAQMQDYHMMPKAFIAPRSTCMKIDKQVRGYKRIPRKLKKKRFGTIN